METAGLRYFNVFGPRQDPEGASAAVIPKWIAASMRGEPVYINGDGETSRDFCHVENAVQANLLAATCEKPEAANQVYNVAVGDQTTLNQLFELLRGDLAKDHPELKDFKATHRDFRSGDVRHSRADITRAKQILGYHPTQDIRSGLTQSLPWYQSTL